jgi:hypothetical protein
VELDRREPLELLPGEFVERDLHRPLQAAAGDDVRNIARVPNADLFQRVTVRGEVSFHPREVGAEEILLCLTPFVVFLLFPRGRRPTGKAEPATGRLQRGEFVGGEFQFDGPHLRQSEERPAVVGVPRRRIRIVRRQESARW